MANTYFKFKQFTINQDKTAMKVGTDGVVLGAYAEADKYNKILDIGTGTGLIALMMAQQNNNAEIAAIEIDNDAYLQALENVEKSKFNNINVLNISLQDFYRKNNRTKFDLIISNPPFFDKKSLKSNDSKRALARHGEKLDYDTLISVSAKMLMPNNSMIKIILPYENLEEVSAIVSRENLFITKQININPTPHKSPKRVILFITCRQSGVKEIEYLTIEQNGRHKYSSHFRSLTEDYYL